MGFKRLHESFTFTDLAMKETLEHNRSLNIMNKLEKVINWSRIESILLSHYTVGARREGADAYPPLLLYKCMLFQKWFRIPFDPELGNQINDRFSFR